MNQHYVSFIRPITWDTVSSLLNTCNQIVQNKIKKLHLLLSSPGGQFYPALAAFNQLKGLPIVIDIYNVGCIGSSAFLIFMAGSSRWACDNASFIFNNIDIPYITDVVEPNGKEMVLKMINDRFLKIVTKETGLIKDDINALCAQGAIKDAHFAEARRIIHGIKELKIPQGGQIIQA